MREEIALTIIWDMKQWGQTTRARLIVISVPRVLGLCLTRVGGTLGHRKPIYVLRPLLVGLLSTPHNMLRRVVVILTFKTLSLALVHLILVRAVIEGITLLRNHGSVVEPG